MPAKTTASDPFDGFPSWLPVPAQHYLAHTEAGTSIRALARRAGCHASTVLRQVRACEALRDDPLIDTGLQRAGDCAREAPSGRPSTKETWGMMDTTHDDICQAVEPDLPPEAFRVLRRMCEPGAVLAVAADMEKALVLRETAPGDTGRTAVADRAVAEVLALKGWISCAAPGRVSRYRVTRAGRAALARATGAASGADRANGFGEAPADFRGAPVTGADTMDADDRPAGRIRYGVAETPLIALARRRDRDGSRFLSSDLVRAGERLREDFEMAGMSTRPSGSWDQLASEAVSCGDAAPGSPGAARARVLAALRDLGPGLGDVALRCCCYLEGLEKAEKRMGWSARSGKIVLRIALQRLRRHYDRLKDGGGMIG